MRVGLDVGVSKPILLIFGQSLRAKETIGRKNNKTRLWIFLLSVGFQLLFFFFLSLELILIVERFGSD